MAFVQPGLPGAIQPQLLSPTDKQRLLEENEEAQKEGGQKLDARQYAAALPYYTRALRAAQRAGDIDHQSKAWLSICYCRNELYQYGPAISACQSSYRLGSQAGNKTWAGGAAGTLANIYRSLGEYSLSEKEALEALRLLADTPRKDFLCINLLDVADLLVERGRFREGLAFSDRAIAVARQAKLPEQEAFAWDIRGYSLLRAGKLPQSAEALQQAQAVRVNGKESAWFSVILGHRSELEFKRGNYAEALRLNDAAYASHSPEFESVPAYYFLHVRGQILIGLNRRPEALLALRRSVELASAFRAAAVPGDNTNTNTGVYLDDVYHDFAQLAAQMAFEQHSAELSREAWQALADNRAASLREQLDATLLRDPHFSDRYFELLSELKAAQARVTLNKNSPQDIAKLQEIRLELSELADQSLRVSTKKENYRFQNSLKGIQTRLRQSEVLLSFCLGKTRSFLWAVTVNDVELYELPKQAEIEQRAQLCTEALRNGHGDDSAESGISRSLFAQLSSQFWQKRDWLIIEDGAAAGLIPYAALRDVSMAGGSQPLIAHHSIRVLPSELLLLLPHSPRPRRCFVGIADPVYNLADSRRASSFHLVHTTDKQPSATLGRLAGSDREVKAAAKLSGMAEEEILTGEDANETSLKNALRNRPEVVHFAVHVVSPQDKPQEAALALSLTSDNLPELLTREAVAAYRVPGSLVILSGCASGQGKALPSAGLIGLSRAWLLAGASAVVVSSWPIPDDSGEFFSAFYNHLHTTVAGSLAQRAATALQEAQLDMQRSGGYRSSPSFWAAYSILSKE